MVDWSGVREDSLKEGWQRHKGTSRVIEMFYIFIGVLINYMDAFFCQTPLNKTNCVHFIIHKLYCN